MGVLARDRVLGDLQRRRRWLDGVTVTGGEPTCAPGLLDFLADLQSTDLAVKLDSNGSHPGLLREVLSSGLAHTIAVDIKGPWDMYPALTGQCMTAQEAQDALGAIFGIAMDFPGRVYFRCTKVPALSLEDLATTAAQVPEGETLIFQEFVPPRK